MKTQIVAAALFLSSVGVLAREAPVEPDAPFRVFADSAEIVSGGYSAGAKVKIVINGESYVDMEGDKGRGLIVVALHKGRELIWEQFDFYADPTASERLHDAVMELPSGCFVVMAVCDEASMNFGKAAFKAIREVGGTNDLSQNFRWSYYLIGRKGFKPGQAIEAWSTNELVHPARTEEDR